MSNSMAANHQLAPAALWQEDPIEAWRQTDRGDAGAERQRYLSGPLSR
jgi:hypothetical protein